MLRDPPDAVILSGDLTLNGDEESLKEFAELLRPIEEAGISLLVMPGNHDVDGVAYRFSGKDVTAEYGATTEEFAQIFESMGLSQAFSRDETSLSYAVKLTEDFWILMIDVNGYGIKGFIPEQTIAWVKDQLRKAKRAKATVLGVSHQNLLLHNERFPFGYQIIGAEELIELYKKYGVKLHFSGHIHMQHIMQADGITDIASSSMAVTPNQYGLLEISPDRSMSYQTVPIDVAGWASEMGKTDENLLHFSDYAAAFFDINTRSKIQDMLEDKTISMEEKERMRAFALDVNRRYFAGSLTDALEDSEGLALWKKNLPEARWTHYFENMITESARGMNHWSSD
ncbi:MAG: metallophosphoesterase [Saccharofermentanales bacterium]